MTQEQQETLNEIFLGKEDPDLAFKKPMTNNLKEEIRNIMDSYIRRDLEELIDVNGAEEELYTLINQKEKELLDKVEAILNESDIAMTAYPGLHTFRPMLLPPDQVESAERQQEDYKTAYERDKLRAELRDRIKQLKEELKGGTQDE